MDRTVQSSSPIAAARVDRRTSALFKTLATDVLLREQFVTDPANIWSEFVGGQRLDPDVSDTANQFLYAVVSNVRLRHWMIDYASDLRGTTPSPHAFARSFAKAVATRGDDLTVLALIRAGAEKQDLFRLQSDLLRAIVSMLGTGASSGTEQSPGTGGTEQSPGATGGTEQSPGAIRFALEGELMRAFATVLSRQRFGASGTEQSPGTGGTEQSPGGTEQSPGAIRFNLQNELLRVVTSVLARQRFGASGTEQSPGTGGTEQSPGTGGTEQSPGAIRIDLENELLRGIRSVLVRQRFSASGTEQSPGTGGTEQSPGTGGTEQSPGAIRFNLEKELLRAVTSVLARQRFGASGTEQSPGTGGTEQSPGTGGTEQSPGAIRFALESELLRAFATVLSRERLGASGTEQSPGTGGTEQSPGTGGTEQSPGAIRFSLQNELLRVVTSVLARQRFGASGTEQSPGTGGTEQSPGTGGTEQSPGAIRFDLENELLRGITRVLARQQGFSASGTEQSPGTGGTEQSPGTGGTEQSPGAIRFSLENHLMNAVNSVLNRRFAPGGIERAPRQLPGSFGVGGEAQTALDALVDFALSLRARGALLSTGLEGQ